MGVKWEGRRGDVLNALEILAADPYLDEKGNDSRWPNLDEAIHWLIDDTWWDHHDPSGTIGLILRNEPKAAAIRRLVDVICQVSDRQDSSDSAWFGDPDWPRVRELATAAIEQLRR